MKYVTEPELITAGKCNLQMIESGILKKKYSLKEISEILPGIIHVNAVDDFSIHFINKYGEEKYGMASEEIAAEGEKFIQRIFEPGTLEVFSEPLIQMIQEDDRSQVISFFQKVELNKNVGYKWLLTTSKILKGRNEFISVSQELSGMDGSIRAVTKLLDDNLYLRKNIKKFGSLTKREKQILKLVTRGLSTKQVAEKLFLSPQTVKTHRKNISKKLDLKRIIDWEYFVNVFEI
ncbi:hypothetical protein GM418_25600 [Maribellus comscasis]|uniref:HTH luxR-type domain-containing protein n=1 Tax=Maribellus comscasis TaxID=2681766 RepID=A0A6I6K0E4_9BACT|nr:helix-turn-helix transcriptional regulator [Maribellus comscasis]QGY46910.1 hypothetical protein GM418_25600 [Maribellus comscasis]